MVFNIFNRLFIGLSLVIVVFSTYFLKLDSYLIMLFLILISYDFLIIKIINRILISVSILISFSLILFFPHEYLKYLCFIQSLIIFFTIFSDKFKKEFFLFSLYIFCMILFYISVIDRNIFYLIILISFFNDTVAYISGKSIGGKLIVPNISPNKTWSGTLISFFATIFLLTFLDYYLLISILSAIFLFLGDIFFSYIKRYLKIKDFSNLLGGHGGMLDRLDSMFFLAIIFQIHLVFIK